MGLMYLLRDQVPKPFEGSNPSLSANYFSRGISCRLSNAENRAILSVLVSQAVSYLLTQSHSRGGTSRSWCIGGIRGGSCHLMEA